jgi:hypothetical protein
MNRLITLLVFLSSTTYGQIRLASGIYEELKLAYDPINNQVTGFYENATGYDNGTGKPKFSCAFYFEGKLSKNKVMIATYSPFDTAVITGELIPGKNCVEIFLSAEHGGCWNVQPFADEAVKFSIDEKHPWIQIRYAVRPKIFFHRNKTENSRLNSYIVQGDIVCIKKLDGDWAYCDYIGRKVTSGWVMIADLNKLRSE